MKFYKSWQRPLALSFDLDDTLYDNVPVMHRAETESQIWMAQQCEAFADWSVERWELYRHESALLAPEMAQDMTSLRVFTLMRALREQGYDKEQARRLAGEGFQHFWHYRNDFKAPAKIRQLLERLGQKFPLIVISNGNADANRIGLDGLFTQVLHPKLNVHRLKPFPDLFRQAEQLTGITGHRWMHVGDHLNTDVNGALNVGWQAAWFNHEHTAIPDCKPTACLPQVELAQLDELAELLL